MNSAFESYQRDYFHNFDVILGCSIRNIKFSTYYSSFGVTKFYNYYWKIILTCKICLFSWLYLFWTLCFSILKNSFSCSNLCFVSFTCLTSSARLMIWSNLRFLQFCAATWKYYRDFQSMPLQFCPHFALNSSYLIFSSPSYVSNKR